MFISAYDTTACIGYQQAINEALVEIKKLRIVSGGDSQIRSIENPFKPKAFFWGVDAIYPGVANIPPFAHPIVDFPEQKAGQVEKDAFMTYIDVRSFSRLNQEREPVISAPRDYKLACARGALQSVWNRQEEYMDILNLGDYQITVYARWISETLSRRLTLPPEVQMKLAVYAAFFYLCQFFPSDKTETDEKDILRFGNLISRCTYVNLQDTLSIIEDLPVLTNIQTFIDLLKEKGESTRYEQLNLALFTSIFSGSWMGANSREMSIVAIEHVPTFVAMLALATTERSATMSVIGKIAETFKKSDQPQVFVYNLSHLIRG